MKRLAVLFWLAIALVLVLLLINDIRPDADIWFASVLSVVGGVALILLTIGGLRATTMSGLPPSYHDLYITTKTKSRTSIFNLPYGLEVTCTRVGGWELWDINAGRDKATLLAGEYAGPNSWLILDVKGHVIVDSRDCEGAA